MEALKTNNLFGVEGLVAVITGGGSGLGLMIAKALDANGAKAVYIIGRREDALKKAAAQGANGSIIPIVGDVTSKDSLAAAASQVEREQGFVNVLLANSGQTGPRVMADLPQDRLPTVKEIKDVNWAPSMEEFTSAMLVNCTGAFYTAMAFLELLDAGNKKGNVHSRSQIIVTSSIAGYSRKLSAGTAYSTSKAAANHLVKVLSTSLLHTQIRVNGIAPGMYPTEMSEQMLARFGGAGKDFSQYGNAPFEMSPLTRFGNDEDMAGTALFLISRAGGYCNGLSIVTDGGRLGSVPSTY